MSIEAMKKSLKDIVRVPTLTHGVLVKLSDVEQAIAEAEKQEPVVYKGLRQPGTERWNLMKDGDDILICNGLHENHENCEYTRYVKAPPQRQPLTDELLDAYHYWRDNRASHGDYIDKVEAIKVAHGIKENT
jgi:hypothetical protein